MKRKKAPSTKSSKGMSLPDAIRHVSNNPVSRGHRKNGTISDRIAQACGNQFHLMIEMMCDERYSGAYIYRVLRAMGVKVSYGYLQQHLRPGFQREYGWFRDIIDKAVDNALGDEPMPIVRNIPEDAFELDDEESSRK